MIQRIHPDPADRAELTEPDLAVATLVGPLHRAPRGRQPPCAHDLFAVAAEPGDNAVDALQTVLAYYAAMRATQSDAP